MHAHPRPSWTVLEVTNTDALYTSTQLAAAVESLFADPASPPALSHVTFALLER